MPRRFNGIDFNIRRIRLQASLASAHAEQGLKFALWKVCGCELGQVLYVSEVLAKSKIPAV